MNHFSTLLRPENVLCDLQAGSKKRLFELVGQSLQATHGIAATAVLDSLLSREKLGSTALGHGIAIPHGRIKELEDTACAFVRLQEPIDFDAPDSLPVDLLFVLMAPAAATDLHLQILAELAQMFSEKEMREKLRATSDAAQIYRLICDWDP